MPCVLLLKNSVTIDGSSYASSVRFPFTDNQFLLADHACLLFKKGMLLHFKMFKEGVLFHFKIFKEGVLFHFKIFKEGVLLKEVMFLKRVCCLWRVVV